MLYANALLLRGLVLLLLLIATGILVNKFIYFFLFIFHGYRLSKVQPWC